LEGDEQPKEDVNLKQTKGDERDERINSLHAQTTALESLSSRYVRNNHILEVENRRLSAEIDRLKALLNQQQKAPKMVGIGMRITDEKPHRVTEIVAGGAAYQSGEIAVGDYILEVGRMVVSQHSIETIRKNVLGQAGSYVDLVLDRRDENDASKIFTVTIKRSEIATGSQLYQRACMPIEVDFARKGAFLRMPLCFSVCEH
jgi:C-terminal processing protease CtpA/Prc